MSVLIMEAERTGYGADQIRRTMTVGELIAFLSDYDENTLIYTSQDKGFTYGGILYENFREEEIEDEFEEEYEEPVEDEYERHLDRLRQFNL